MNYPSGFALINFKLAGKIFFVVGILCLLLKLIAFLTDWFYVPFSMIIVGIVFIVISLYLICVVPSESDSGKKKSRSKKILIISGIILIVIIIVWRSLFFIKFKSEKPIEYGVTFSQKYASELELDWKKVYLEILDDLEVKNIRLVAHWDLVETEQNKFDFSDLDWQMDKANQYNAKIIFAIGRRVPRWPECHDPEWLSKLSQDEQKEAQLSYTESIVEKFKNHPALQMWQVENEYFLELFGECPPPDKEFYKKEINLVKLTDFNHPIMVTDSGEFGTWVRTRDLSEYLGTSVYRVVYNPWTGYVDYGWFIPSSFYRIKAGIIGKPIDKIIVTEFQAEPWAPGNLKDVSFKEQDKSMSIKRFKTNIEVSKELGFERVYFWGVEWWYWMKTQGHPEFWETVKDLY